MQAWGSIVYRRGMHMLLQDDLIALYSLHAMKEGLLRTLEWQKQLRSERSACISSTATHVLSTLLCTLESSLRRLSRFCLECWTILSQPNHVHRYQVMVRSLKPRSVRDRQSMTREHSVCTRELRSPEACPTRSWILSFHLYIPKAWERQWLENYLETVLILL